MYYSRCVFRRMLLQSSVEENYIVMVALKHNKKQLRGRNMEGIM
jgi:hypothetical protein